MPKVTLATNSKDTDIRVVIAEGLVYHNMKVDDLIRKTGMKKSSYFRAKKNPELFKVGDLRNIYDVLKIPEDERKGL